MSSLEIINSSGLISILTLSIAFLSLSIRFCFLSKCTHCNLCYGLIDITRNGQLENEEHIDFIPDKI